MEHALDPRTHLPHAALMAAVGLVLLVASRREAFQRGSRTMLHGAGASLLMSAPCYALGIAFRAIAGPTPGPDVPLIIAAAPLLAGAMGWLAWMRTPVAR